MLFQIKVGATFAHIFREFAPISNLCPDFEEILDFARILNNFARIFTK